MIFFNIISLPIRNWFRSFDKYIEESNQTNGQYSNFNITNEQMRCQEHTKWLNICFFILTICYIFQYLLQPPRYNTSIGHFGIEFWSSTLFKISLHFWQKFAKHRQSWAIDCKLAKNWIWRKIRSGCWIQKSKSCCGNIFQDFWSMLHLCCWNNSSSRRGT